MENQSIEIKESDKVLAPLEQKATPILSGFSRFISNQTSAGVILLIATIVAIAWANSDHYSSYESLKNLKLTLSLEQWSISHSLKHWMNDGLMVLFFFMLGLEIKHAILAGELKDIRQSVLVIMMALGGMLIPALVYYFTLNMIGASDSTYTGWGIPMATDAAFVIAILLALGKRVPYLIIVMVTALAIIDDLGAVLVISLFYTENIQLTYLGYALLTFGVTWAASIIGVRWGWFYLLGGLTLWWWISHSGIHATTAGILVAILVPTQAHAKTQWFITQMDIILKRFKKVDDPDKPILQVDEQQELAEQAQQVALKSASPMQLWANNLSKPVNFLIIPLFALLNAGVSVPTDNFTLASLNVFWAVALGLLVGKPLGITLFAWLSVRTGLITLPKALTFSHIVGVGFLAGIGFTMSLFIGSLAFEEVPNLLIQTKLGILVSSVLAAIIGTLILINAGQREDKVKTSARAMNQAAE